MFEAGPDGLMQSVSGSDPQHWSQAMKDALGLVKDGFPFQLTLNKNPERSIPAVDFSASAQRVGNVSTRNKKSTPRPRSFSKQISETFSRTQRSHTKQERRQKNGWPAQI